MSMASAKDLLIDQMKDIYNAEHQILKALPRMARRAGNDMLREAFERHAEETRGQIERLEQAAQALGTALRGKKCAGMQGLLEEGKEIMEEDGHDTLIDAGMIAAAQKVEHYEISAYGSARALAEQLGLQEIVPLLQANLDEESATDEKLTQLSEGTILPAALQFAEEDEEDEQQSGRNGRQRRAAGSDRGRSSGQRGTRSRSSSGSSGKSSSRGSSRSGRSGTTSRSRSSGSRSSASRGRTASRR